MRDKTFLSILKNTTHAEDIKGALAGLGRLIFPALAKLAESGLEAC